jgi:hypothetical protein
MSSIFEAPPENARQCPYWQFKEVHINLAAKGDCMAPGGHIWIDEGDSCCGAGYRKIPKPPERVKKWNPDLSFQADSFDLQTADKVSQILDQLPETSEGLRTSIIYWSDIIFNPFISYLTTTNYNQETDPENSLHQVWKVAALLANTIDLTNNENRELTSREDIDIKYSFISASAARYQEALKTQSNLLVIESQQLFKIGFGGDTLIYIARQLNANP